MSKKVIEFTPPANHRRGVIATPIFGPIDRHNVGDGLSMSTRLSSENQRECLHQKILSDYPSFKHSEIVDPGLIELWRGDELVAICEVKGGLSNDDGSGKWGGPKIKGTVALGMSYGIPSECPKSIASKFVMTLFILLRQALQSNLDNGRSNGLKAYLDFCVNTDTAHGQCVFNTLKEVLCEFSGEAKALGFDECFCYLSKESDKSGA